MEGIMKSKCKTAIFILLAMTFFFQCNTAVASKTKTDTDEVRPKEWAVPMARPGLPNLNKVSDQLYRGAQPKKAGFAELKKLGVKTIVNFRRRNTDKKYLGDYGFKYIFIPVNTRKPKHEQFARFLELFSNPENLPVFVHCKHGADRTGAAVSLYRVHYQRWTVEKAIHEMVNGGYNFHRRFQNLKTFIREFKFKTSQ